MIEYDSNTKTWKVNIPGCGIEEGNLLYVVSEYTRSGLIFPYNTEQTINCEYHGHTHEFDGVLKALINCPESFSIDGFEKYYSEQEITLLHDLREKLISERK